MHCREPLNEEFLNDNTGKGWRLSTYKTYRENKLFDIEKARLPETQPYSKYYKEAQKLYECWDALWKKYINYPIDEESNLANIRRAKLNRDSWLRIVDNFGRPHGIQCDKQALVAKFIKGCPAAHCRGFLGEDFICGLCEVKVCTDCHEIKGAEHACNTDTVASVKVLLKESTPCPKCASVISKIDGCDQMWCTQCQTAFSWSTGLEEKGRIHNPHFYEWARRNGTLRRENEGYDCDAPRIDDLINGFNLETRLEYDRLKTGWDRYIDYQRAYGWLENNPDALAKRKASYPKRGLDKWQIPPLTDKEIIPPPFPSSIPQDNVIRLATVFEFHRALGHMNQLRDIPLPDNHSLRVKYLVGEITEAQMRTELQMNDKVYRVDRALQQINQMVAAASVDIFRNYVASTIYDTFFDEMLALTDYANEARDKISKTYNIKAGKIDLNFAR